MEHDITHTTAEPSESKPAPGELGLVQAFLNTVDLEGGVDELGDAAELRAWLLERELLDEEASVDEADLGRALGVREALRALLAANNGERPDPRAVDLLNEVGADAKLIVHFHPDGHAHLRPGSPGVVGALGVLLGIVYTAMAEGTWQRLKACRNDVCRWAYYDHSKNRSGAWCTMRTCGSQMKARAYRERRKAGA